MNSKSMTEQIVKAFIEAIFKIFESVGEQFFTRFSKFREIEEAANFMRFPNSIKMEELNLQKFLWIDILDKFKMKFIEFQSSSI